MGLARSDEAVEIAQRENEVIKYDDSDQESGLTEESIILATMAQNAYNKESQDFADMIQASLAKHTGVRNRGVRQAGFYVMVGASMPNVLVETAFLSNKKEERLLKSSSFQQKVAQGIYESVKERAELKRDQIHAYGADWRIPHCRGSMSAILQPAGTTC